MNPSASAPLFHVWSHNKIDEASLELPALVSRVKSGQVHAKSWVFTEDNDAWRHASEIPELKMFFKAPSTGDGAPSGSALRPGMLRRIKLFAEMDDAQLATFMKCVELLKFKQFSTVVQKGHHGDSMYLVMEGELRARIMVDQKEVALGTMGVGDFFGEIALLDHGPRSADVIANEDSTVLKISAASIDKIIVESPSSAAKFLRALAKYVAGRTRAITKRYEDTIHFSRAAAQVGF